VCCAACATRDRSWPSSWPPAWGFRRLSEYTLPTDHVFLELNELRKPRAFEVLGYTNATSRFTTSSRLPTLSPERDRRRCPARDVSLATQTFKESRAATFGHHDADSSARLDPVKALASLDAIRGSRP
jgi:hypothetical protein